MASHDQITARITAAQEAIDAEIRNVAAALGQPAPKLKRPYAATQYEQIAVHLESVRDALAKVNQAAADDATEEAESDESGLNTSTASTPEPEPANTPTTSTRRGKATAADLTPDLES